MHNCQVLAALPGLKHACMAGSRVAEQVKSGQHSEGDDITVKVGLAHAWLEAEGLAVL